MMDRMKGVREMEAKRVVLWKLGDGRQAEAEINVTRATVADIAYADGLNIDLGKMPVEFLNITVKIDGKYVERSTNPPSVVEDENVWGKDFVAKVKSLGCYARLTNRIVIKENVYDEIMAAIKEATEEASQDAEYKLYTERERAAAEVSRPAEEAREKDLAEREIPQEALTAYSRYRGDEEAAWGEGDEMAWALIKKWAPYIEAQHGMAAQKLQKQIKEAAREENLTFRD